MLASKVATEAVEAFKVREEYRQKVLVTCRDTFLQGFKLCRSRAIELFPDMDVRKLKVELPLGDSEGSDGEDMGKDGDPIILP